MRVTRQELRCPACDACVIVELRGAHDLRSSGQELEDLATRAGWRHGKCPEHRWLGVPVEERKL